MFIYDVIEDFMNINEAVKIHCLLMKYIRFQIAISKKPDLIIGLKLHNAGVPFSCDGSFYFYQKFIVKKKREKSKVH